MLEQIDVTEAREALLTIRQRVAQYAWLLGAVRDRDVSEDRHFRRAYLSFYKLRQKEREFCRFYFAYLEEHKGRKVTFEETLLAIYQEFGVLDPGSASKLVSLLRPETPVWDSQILWNLGIKPLGSSHSARQVEETLWAYRQMEKWYQRYLLSRDGRMAVRVFDEVYPDTGFSDMKKADFVIWSILWS